MNRPVPTSVFSDQRRTKSTTWSRTSCGTHTLVRAPQDFFLGDVLGHQFGQHLVFGLDLFFQKLDPLLFRLVIWTALALEGGRTILEELLLPTVEHRQCYFAGVAVGRPCNRSLLIFSTTPALRSAASLTLYSADVPSTCATSEGVSAYLSVSQLAIFVVASRNASSIDPSSPTAMICVADSTRGPGTPLPEITSTVNSTSIDVSSAFPFNSPSPCAAWPSPRYSIAPGVLTGK